MSTGSILLFCIPYVSYSVFTCSCSHLLETHEHSHLLPFQYTFRAVVLIMKCSVCDQSPTHCLLTDFILTTSRSFSLRRRRRVKAGNVTWVTCLVIRFILCTTSKRAQYALKSKWYSVCKLFYSCFYHFFPVRPVTSPSVGAPIWRSTWSYIHRTNPSSVPTVTTTSSHDLPGWSTKKNSI